MTGREHTYFFKTRSAATQYGRDNQYLNRYMVFPVAVEGGQTVYKVVMTPKTNAEINGVKRTPKRCNLKRTARGRNK